jgi:Family of unknown function (DUF6348)
MIEDLYRLAIDALRHHLRQAGQSFTEDDGDLIVADHRLGLSIAFEGFEYQGGQTIAPLDIAIHLDGDTGDRFRVGTLGIGPDQLRAMEAGIAEWHLLAAGPVLAAIGAEAGTRRRDSAPRKLAGWDLFPGRVGVRGSIPAGLQAGGGFFQTLLKAIHQFVSRWETPTHFQLRSIFIMATVADGPAEVQAAVDGFLNAELTEALAALAWPTGQDPYLYKQLFVLRGNG